MPGGIPSDDDGGEGVLCQLPTYPNPVCYATDVLGAADLDCESRKFSLRL